MKRSMPLIAALALLLSLAGPRSLQASIAPPVKDSAPKTQRSAPEIRRTAITYNIAFGLIPKSVKRFDAWAPLPWKNDVQEISDLTMQAPGGGTMGIEGVNGNLVFHSSSGPRGGVDFNVILRFVVERHAIRFEDLSRPPSDPPEPPKNLAIYLQGSRLAPIDAKVKSLAERVVRKGKTVQEKARAIFDYVVDNMTLSQAKDGWGEGNLQYVLDNHMGNSLDVGTLFVSLCRGAGIPARTDVGFILPRNSTSGIVSGFYAWAEFWLPGFGWIPVDPTAAIAKPSARNAYFAALGADHVLMSVGRDLILNPPQEGSPLNVLIGPYAEADGKPFPNSAFKIRFEKAAPAPDKTSPASP
ncbi:MAG TPA: transglutaminase-like domain-containing protein [Candidatus Saccharimonadales bacterium]|nr:transglutaminase-like domain-containing protein [Candidatus Saccharimonadales bacterium]